MNLGKVVMENGRLIEEKFGGLNLNANSNANVNVNVNDDDIIGGKDNSLVQVMKTLDAAEATIRQQVEENNRLRAELQKREHELENFNVDKPLSQRFYSVDENSQGANRTHQTAPVLDSPSTLALHRKQSEDLAQRYHVEGQSDIGRSNGNLTTLSGGHVSDNTGFTQFPPSPAMSYSPGRFLKDGEYDGHLNGAGQGLMSVTESNNHNNMWKQIREHEEEIIQLRKHLSDYSVKEAQIRNEKYVLEKRIAHMRMAFDQQQQDLVDAASKALSYRQDIIEENVRLTYALQDAQQERTIFISSLLPLLAEYSLQPQVSDAQSIVSNIKVLFKHLQEKLIITEAKLKEYQYQLMPWRSDGNSPNFAPQSPEHSSGAALTSSKLGLELVPRPTYSPTNMGNSDGQIAIDWESRGQHVVRAGAMDTAVENSELDNVGRYSPLASRDAGINDVSSSAQVSDSRQESHATQNRQVKFKDPVISSEVYGESAEGYHTEREHAGGWSSETSTYSNTAEDPSTSHSPYLHTVPEEPSSSFSEAAEDDPLPGIEGLQISGEAYPGRELQACGYSINGTTSCNFEWVRHLEDGSVKYIDGAKQPAYLITADDVDTYLAIEVQPLDDRKRKGELVRVFANEHRKITCDPVMQSHIEQNLRNGHASYRVSLSTGYLDIWEPANLTIKRDGYTIKGSGSSSVAANEKFSPGTTVNITYGQDLDFSIFNSSGDMNLMRVENYIPDIISLRDTIVLTLRLFIMKASQNGKGKRRRVKFFSK